jgi:hypothetical protein
MLGVARHHTIPFPKGWPPVPHRASNPGDAGLPVLHVPYHEPPCEDTEVGYCG